MKQQDSHINSGKAKIKALPGNVKLTIGESIVKKYEFAKAVSASIKGFKK